MEGKEERVSYRIALPPPSLGLPGLPELPWPQPGGSHHRGRAPGALLTLGVKAGSFLLLERPPGPRGPSASAPCSGRGLGTYGGRSTNKLPQCPTDPLPIPPASEPWSSRHLLPPQSRARADRTALGDLQCPPHPVPDGTPAHPITSSELSLPESLRDESPSELEAALRCRGSPELPRPRYRSAQRATAGNWWNESLSPRYLHQGTAMSGPQDRPPPPPHTCHSPAVGHHRGARGLGAARPAPPGGRQGLCGAKEISAPQGLPYPTPCWGLEQEPRFPPGTSQPAAPNMQIGGCLPGPGLQHPTRTLRAPAASPHRSRAANPHGHDSPSWSLTPRGLSSELSCRAERRAPLLSRRLRLAALRGGERGTPSDPPRSKGHWSTVRAPRSQQSCRELPWPSPE